MRILEIANNDEELEQRLNDLSVGIGIEGYDFILKLIDMDESEIFEKIFYNASLLEIGTFCNIPKGLVNTRNEEALELIKKFEANSQETRAKIKPIFEGFISYLIDNPENQERYSTGDISLDMTLPEVQSQMKENSEFQDEDVQSGYDKLLDCLNM